MLLRLAQIFFWGLQVSAYPHMVALLPRDHATISTPAKRGGCNIGTSGLTEKHFKWAPAGDGDLRSPCPVMNTLANHDFVPHSGRNITEPILVKACKEAFNISNSFAANIFKNGIVSNPAPNATFFDLDMLHHTHGVIEHDGSLSRRDAVFDPTNPFDEGTFSNLLKYFGNATTFNIATLANARSRQAFDMSLINPNFTITEGAVPVIMGENAMMIAIWGGPETQIGNLDYFKYFFRNERIPVKLGWTPSQVEIGATIGQIVQDLIKLSPADVPLTYSPASA
ncbi:Peroxidase, family 2-domain-containing protein [Truncatella angustata]|uniref:Peroxidase, family 2-domain-containing protein n=1 Tax=Truncatella angustata TaxID=152316 RepID=A0A9P8RG02_9PEZI|nr:Peroxidase, family 2-domain-containing protein [Truncatella angustata]KAH6645323.1 Peroxidase, family 2-domain-containing protein [Truncatella angustata]KAH8203310.1 hypothetical protein TruAng_002506 [Truncatella angustata]